MRSIFRKELADYFTSLRVFILFVLIYLASAAGLHAAQQGIRGDVISSGFGATEMVFLKLFTSSGEKLPSFASFISLFVPIIGIALGFDAINREYSSGTMSRILSQPLYRDSVINGKFLAGMVTLYFMILATMLIVSGAGLSMIGVPPEPEEIIRLFIWFFFILVYGGFWMSLAILFSAVFRRIATSLLATIGLWLLFSFFIPGLIAPAIADAMVPVTTQSTQEVILRNFDIVQIVQRFSPDFLFGQVTTVLLSPVVRSLGLITMSQAARMVPNPLSLGQSLLLIWPLLTSLLSLTVICFAASYVSFMRQEIRST